MGRGCFRERRTGFQGASNVLVHKLGSGYLGVCFLFFKLYVHILYTFCMNNIFHNLNILNGLDRPEGPPSNSLILKFHKTQSVWKLENQQNDMPESQSLRSGYVLSYHLALSFYKWGHWAPGRWGYVFEVTQHLSGRLGTCKTVRTTFHTRAVCKSSSRHYIYSEHSIWICSKQF